jgi:hypothetical protein
MATRGFEPDFTLDGAGGPMERDFTLGTTTAVRKGDVMLMQSDGYIDPVTGSVGEVTCIAAQAKATADITAGTTTIKAWPVTRDQVWKCSMDAASTLAVPYHTKTLDLADQRTLDADDLVNGSICPIDVSNTDDEGNIEALVVFLDTSAGNT